MVSQRTLAPGRPSVAEAVEASPLCPVPEVNAAAEVVDHVSERRPWYLVLLLGSLAAFTPLAIDMYLPAFDGIAADLGVPVGAVQLTLASYLAGMAIGQLVCGPISDRYGRRGPLLVGCVGFVISAAVCGSMRSIEGLIAARFLMGLAGSAGVVISRAIVRDLYSGLDLNRIYALMMLVVAVAPLVAPSLGGLLVRFGGWRTIFAVLTACGGLSLAVILFGLPETLPAARRTRRSAWTLPAQYFGLLFDGRFTGPTLAVACGSGALFAYVTGSSFVFMQLYGVPKDWYGVVFASNAAGLFAMTQLNQVLLRWFTSRQIVAAAARCLFGVSLVLLACVATGVGGFPVVYGCLFCCMSCPGLRAAERDRRGDVSLRPAGGGRRRRCWGCCNSRSVRSAGRWSACSPTVPRFRWPPSSPASPGRRGGSWN